MEAYLYLTEYGEASSKLNAETALGQLKYAENAGYWITQSTYPRELGI